MQRLYKISPHSGWSLATAIDGTSEAGLLSVDCPRCGTWGDISYIYPTINPRGLRSVAVQGRCQWLTPVQFAEYAEDLLLTLGDRRCVPGARIGSFVGEYPTAADAIVWSQLYYMLLREDLVRALSHDYNITLPGEWAQLLPRTDALPRYFEPEGNMRLRAKGWREIPLCEVCGRKTSPQSSSPVFDSSTLDDNTLFYRTCDGITSLIVTERLRVALEAIAPGAATYDAVECA
jgi:hypothetical protein